MGKLMLRETERTASKIFIWSYEKIFMIEVVSIKQNKRFDARRSIDFLVNVRGHFRRQKPVWVTVWAAVADLLWSSLMKALKSTASLFEPVVGKETLTSQKLLRTSTPSNRTVLQLTQRMRPSSDARVTCQAFEWSNRVLISIPWSLLSGFIRLWIF